MPNGNPFDQFDNLAMNETNPFDQFDDSSSSIPALVSPYKEKQKKLPLTKTGNVQNIRDIVSASNNQNIVSPNIQPSNLIQQGNNVVEAPRSRKADPITKGIIQGASEPVLGFNNTLNNAADEIGQGKLGQATVDALLATIEAGTTPFTIPYGAAMGGLKGSGKTGTQIAEGLENVMNLPFTAIAHGSELTNDTLKALGINPTLGNKDLEAKANQLVQNIGGLAALGAVHHGVNKINEKAVPLPVVEPSGIANVPPVGVPPIEEINKENQNAVQERGAGEVLQRQPEGIGETGSERGGVEQIEQGNEPAGTRGNNIGTKTSEEGNTPGEVVPQEVKSEEVTNQLPPEIAPKPTETGQGSIDNRGANKVLTPEEYQALKDKLNNPPAENPFDQFDGFEEVKPITKSETTLSNPVENIPNNIPVSKSTDQTVGKNLSGKDGTRQNLSNEDKINSLKSDLVDLRDNYNDLTGSARMKARKPIQDKIKELRALGVDADFKIGKITIDGKPLRKPTVQPERVDISKVEVKPEAGKTFEELTPDVRDRQEIIAENLVEPNDLPTGAGKKTYEKGVQDIKDDNGKEVSPEAKIVRDAAEHILENGKEIQPIKGARNSKQQISPDEVKSFVDQNIEEKSKANESGDTSFNFGENAKNDFELTPPETKGNKSKPEQLEMEGLGAPSFNKGEEYLKPTGKSEETTPLFNQETEAKGQENLFDNKSPSESKPTGIKITQNKGRIEITSDKEFQDQTIKDLKAHGFRQDSKTGQWYAMHTERRLKFANELAERGEKDLFPKSEETPEAVERKNLLLNQKPMELSSKEFEGVDDIKEMRAKAKTIYDKLKPTVNKINNHTVEFIKKGFKEIRAYSADSRKLKLVPYLDKIIEEAIPLFKEPRNKPGKENIANYNHYAAKVNLDGKEIFVRVTTYQTKEGKEYWDFLHDTNITEADKIKEDLSSLPYRIDNSESGSAPKSSADKLINWIDKVKNFEKPSGNEIFPHQKTTNIENDRTENLNLNVKEPNFSYGKEENISNSEGKPQGEEVRSENKVPAEETPEENKLRYQLLNTQKRNDGRSLANEVIGKYIRSGDKIYDLSKIDKTIQASATNDSLIPLDELRKSELPDVSTIDKFNNEKTPNIEKSKRFISDETYKKAQQNIITKGQNLTAGIDPTLLKDYATIGAYHVESGARNFIDWSKKMIDDFGEKIKPYLLDIWRQTKNDYSHLFKEEKSSAPVKEENANLSENQTSTSQKFEKETKNKSAGPTYEEAKKNNDYQAVGKYHLEDLKIELGDKADIYPTWRKRMVKDFGLNTGENFRKIWNDIKNKPELSTSDSVTPEGKIVEQPELNRTPGTAKAAFDINNRMVKKGMAELPDTELAKYNPISKADQIDRVTKQLDSDYEKSKLMAAGKETVPPDIHPQVLFNAVKNRAIEEKDIETLKDLALSPLAKERSVAAQTLSASGFNNGDKVDPVKAMSDVIDSREKSWNRQNLSKRAAEYEKKIQDLETKLQEKDDLLKKAESERAFKKIKRDSDYQARRERRTMTKDQLKEERTHLYADLYKELATVNEGVPITGKSLKILGSLVRNYAQEGLISAESVIDAIHNELKDKIEGITPRDIRDAISRYGQETKTKTRTQLEKDVQDLKNQMKTISQIEDLEAGKVPDSTIRTKTKPTEELQALRNELKTKLDEHGITEQKNLTRSKELIKKKILDYTDKINKGEYSKEEKISPVDDEKITLQKQLEDVRKRWNYIRESLGEVLSSEEAKNITDLSQKIAEAKAKMENAPRRELGKPPTPEEWEYGKTRVAFAEYVDTLKRSVEKLTWNDFKNKPVPTILNALKHIPGITKSAKATLDNSGLLNQNIKTLWTHPTIWGKNAIESFRDIIKTLGKKNVYDELSADIVSRPNYENYLRDGLAVGVIEEAFPDSKVLEKIPFLGRVHKAADAAFTGLAYRNRADLYDLYTEIAKNNGYTETTGLGLGKLCNSLTGRGNLGGFERSADMFNVLLFSPRYIKSHFDVLTAHVFDKDVSSFAKKEAAKNLLKIIGGSAAVMATANALVPGSTETDPLSSDFGSIKVGDTRFHFMGGMNSLITLASRLITLSSKSTTTGKIIKLNSGKYGSQTGWGVLENFVEGKLSPIAGLLKDYLKGESFGGERVTVGGELQSLVVPLPLINYQEFINDPKSANIVAGMIADGLGIFTNTYSNDPDLRKVKNALLKADREKMSNEARSNFFHSVYKAERNQAITPEQATQYRKQFNDLQRTAPRKMKVKTESNHAAEG